ncbi:S-adenosyl-L-methionine-dependent methyltransferase, partial [Stipitochalara longipes BDJ]
SSKASVRSSLYEYIEENGRKYHRYKAGTYMLPNDESEQDRLDLQHHLFLLGLHGRLYLAPIEDGPLHNVLDVATGTGIWATDFASTFPAAHVRGTDLSLIQPPHGLPNCRFEIADAEDEWSFSNPFDYIHGRALMTCFKDHVPVFKSAFDALRPGGYFEMQDAAIPFRSIDGSMKGTAFERWLGLVKEGTHALGRDFGKVPNYKSYFEAVGFVDIVEKQFAWPIGSWAKDPRMKMLGAWVQEDVLTGLHGWSAAVLTRGLGMSSQEVETLLTEVKSDINSNWLHTYIPIFIVYGRKPSEIFTSEPVTQ